MELSDRDDANHEPPAPLRMSDFDHRIGESFVIEAEIGSVSLTLAEVRELPHSRRDGGGFRLEFRGPRESMLPQAIYAFGIDGEPRDIFIVPLDPRSGDDACYEAIFF